MVGDDGEVFTSVSHSDSEVASSETRAHDPLRGALFWAAAEAGPVRLGTRFAEGGDDGVPDSVAEVLGDGRLPVLERWRWTAGEECLRHSLEDLRG